MPGALCIWALPSLAGDLGWPVDCTLGATCFVQHHVDRAPGAKVQDFGCGSLSYDGHDGTDIALPNRAAMDEGVAVRAALSGRVKAIRDGLPDAAPFPKGQDCGNGLLIESAAGEEQYCHLRQGSVVVRPGDMVAAGDALGLVGQSGAADFPHLHLTVRRGGVAVDPFSTARTCGPGQELWAAPLPYVPAGLVQAGISDAVPEYDAVKDGKLPAPKAHAGALVIWGEAYGTRPGDLLAFDLRGPEGEIHQGAVTLDRAQDRSFRAQGRKLDLDRGDYGGTVSLWRDGKQLARIEVKARLD